MKKIFVIGLVLILTACAAPRTNVQTDNQDGTVVFEVTPGSAIVFVNGKEIGEARRFSGISAVLSLPPGNHRIVVRNGDRSCARDIYISDTQEVVKCNLD